MTGKLYLGLAFLALLLISNAVVGYKAYQFGAHSVQVRWYEAETKRNQEIAAKNEAILKQRPKVKHENQNRDRDALVRHICDRGWVRDPSQCAAYR